ncbi:Magnesium transporter [Gammaproteobacteria bacterium]
MLNTPIADHKKEQSDLALLLQKYKLLTHMLHNQEIPRHDLVESLVRKQGLAQLHQSLEQMASLEIAHQIETLPPEDQVLIWDQAPEGKKEDILREIPLSVLYVLGKREFEKERSRVKVFGLKEGRLCEIDIDTREDLVSSHPIWIDLVAPSFEERVWVGGSFGIELPDPERLGDLESSARFYIEKNDDIHLHSDFLLDRKEMSRSVAVAFILYKSILFSIRQEELPVFRLQRLRALSNPGYVSDSMDVLLDLYAADAEYSAEALEDVYRGLEDAGKQVLSKQVTDEEAATILTIVAHEEDLNGLIRRNMLDTRRAVSFLMRSRLLKEQQIRDAQQILRDIESIDGHTTFLFGKINFLMDATVGFININQNKVIKRLTIVSVVFMPLNVLSGIGGMSEFSAITQDIPKSISYSAFVIGLGIVGWLTHLLLQFFENREIRNTTTSSRKSGSES